MALLIVGADRLGNIPEYLHSRGANEIIHWSGRQKSFRNRRIPNKVEQVIIFYDFVNHNLMQSIKKQSKSKNIPVVYGKRALIAI